MASTTGYVSLFTTRAHVFQINPETKTSWLPKGDSAIPISFITTQADSPATKKQLKIIGTADNGEIALDCTLSWDTVFNKRSQKFVQWPDDTGIIYGLGFNSEVDLNEFIETFIELRHKVLSSETLNARQQPDWNGSQHQHQQTSDSSEMNSRIATDYTAVTSARASGANPNARYPSSLGYIAATKPTSSLVNSSSMNSGSASESARYPPRSQSTTGLQANKSNGFVNDSNGSIRGIGCVSPDVEDSHSIHSEHQVREQLKYENERLKQALEESSKNASLWQNELMNLRTNNVKLTQALQESRAHVEEWEKELLSLRDENKELKLRAMALESTSDSSKGEEFKDELQKYKNYVDKIQSELRRKENEVEDLQRSMEQLEVRANSRNGDSETSETMKINSVLRQKIDAINAKLEANTSELVSIQKEFAQLVEKLHLSI